MKKRRIRRKRKKRRRKIHIHIQIHIYVYLQLPASTSRTRQLRRGKRRSSQSPGRNITCEDGDITAGRVRDSHEILSVEGDEGEVTWAQTTGAGQANEGQGSVGVDGPGGNRVG